MNRGLFFAFDAEHLIIRFFFFRELRFQQIIIGYAE